MSNLATPPSIQIDYDLKFPFVDYQLLGNGLQVHMIRGGQSGIIRFDFVWKGGRNTEKYPAVARSAMASLKDGYPGMSGDDLLEHFDFYGSTIRHRAGQEFLSSNMAVLTKHLENVLPQYIASIFDVSVDQKALVNRQKRLAQRLQQELQKNNVIAYRQFTEQLFGEDHIYGYSTQPDDYLQVEKYMVLDYLKDHIVTKDCHLIISGDIDTRTERYIFNQIEEIQRRRSKIKLPKHSPVEAIPSKRIDFKGPQTDQCSIRVGKLMFGRDHKDFYTARLANVLIGGYFGSRLMTKVREEKGYCYHIDSVVDCFSDDGYFSISSEVSPQNVEDCIKQIDIELQKLTTIATSDNELSRIKQYLKGQILIDTDGVFACAAMLKRLLASGHDEDEFSMMLKQLDKITAEDLRECCVKHFNPKDFTYLVVSGKQ